MAVSPSVLGRAGASAGSFLARRDEIGSFVEPRFRHAVDRTVDLVSAAFAELSAAFTARVRVFHRGVSCGLGIDL